MTIEFSILEEESNERSDTFRIMLDKPVYDRIKWLTHNYEKEISAWLGGEIKNNVITIDDIMFPEQDIGYGHTIVDGKRVVKMVEEYGDRFDRVIGQWHSHNKMKAHWSSGDEKFIDNFMQNVDVRLFLVSSIPDDILARIEINLNSMNERISFNGLKYEIRYNEENVKEEMEEVIKNKCHEPKSSFAWNKNTNPWLGSGWYGGYKESCSSCGCFMSDDDTCNNKRCHRYKKIYKECALCHNQIKFNNPKNAPQGDFYLCRRCKYKGGHGI